MMNKLIELRKMITAVLKAAHPDVVVDGASKSRVHFQVAPDDAEFPYVVYDLPNSIDDGTMENFRLEVDGWDAPADGDTTALETLMDNIDQELHRAVKTMPGLSAVFYRDNRLALLDDDKRIRRRKYIYQARTFGGG